jgi:hypothetical protein
LCAEVKSLRRLHNASRTEDAHMASSQKVRAGSLLPRHPDGHWQ